MLNNIIWFMPEIYLSGMTVLLLGYGVIFSKLDGEISQQKKITWLSILSLLFTALLEFNQYLAIIGRCEGGSSITSTNSGGVELGSIVGQDHAVLYISNGLYGVDSTIIGIKIAILLGSLGVLLMSLNLASQPSFFASQPSGAKPQQAALRSKAQGVDLGDYSKDYEFTQLILLSTLGMLLLISSKDLISLYLAIELISLSLYILAAIKRDGQFSTEAGIKYFLLGAVASGLLLFGSTLIYWLTGETSFVGLSNYIWYSPYTSSGFGLDNNISLSIAAMFIIIALLFKLAAAPFHMWAPDVYEGSPTIVTAYFAIVPKIATLGVLYQLLFGPFSSLFTQLQPFLLVSALLSIIIGSLGAINQTKLKRLIAYSAIAHMGFMLIGLSTGALSGLLATFLYMLVYMITSFNTFAFVLSLNSPNYISQLTGLSRHNPTLAMTFALSLFSMAGIPPLAGFFSKYLVLLSAIGNGLYFVAFIAILFSVVGSFYYLRLIKWMFFRDSSSFLFKTLNDITLRGNPIASHQFGGFGSTKSAQTINVSLINSLILGASLFILLTLLIYPNPLLNIIFESLSSSLF